VIAVGDERHRGDPGLEELAALLELERRADLGEVVADHVRQMLQLHLHAVVLVVRHGKSSKHAVRRSRDLLLRSGSPITGIVLNAVDLNSPEYYGYYGYSGYSYSSVDSESWESQAAEPGSRRGGRG